MKVEYYPDTDTLYIFLSEREGSDVRTPTEGFVVDVDDDGRPIGFEIEHASELTDLTDLELSDLPVHRFATSTAES